MCVPLPEIQVGLLQALLQAISTFVSLDLVIFRGAPDPETPRDPRMQPAINYGKQPSFHQSELQCLASKKLYSTMSPAKYLASLVPEFPGCCQDPIVVPSSCTPNICRNWRIILQNGFDSKKYNRPNTQQWSITKPGCKKNGSWIVPLFLKLRHPTFLDKPKSETIG